MFEAQAAYYLNKYLGRYVDGVDTNSLQISVWNGDVVLRNLRVRPEALTDLNLPVTVRAGLLGTLRLKVPWNKLGKEPVVVEMDKLYILAGPFEEPGKFDSEKALDDFVKAFNDRMHEQKRRRVKAIELEWMQRKDGEASDKEKSGGYLQYYIETILGNLELKITNVHIRYEDGQSSPGQQFGVGFTLGELSGHTVDKNGDRAFVNAKQMDQIRKRIKLKRLAMYFDANAELWGSQENWLRKTEKEWDSFFLPSIHKELHGSQTVYILRPVDGYLMYLRRRKIGGKDLLESDARQEIDMFLQEISIHASRRQYEHVQNLLTSFNLYQLSLPHRHLRPPCRPLNPKSAAMWWTYAIKAVRLSILGRSMSSPFKELCNIRRLYVPHYARCLQHGEVGGDKTISSMEKSLEEVTILVFRRLAHVKVEQDARQKALKAAAARPATWGEWLWGTKPSEEEDLMDSSKTEIATLSDEDWAAFDSLVGVHDDDDTQHTPWTLLSRIRANVGTCSASLSDENEEQILYGAWSDAILVNKVYPETNSVDFSIGQGTMRCPSGTLMSPGNSPHTSGTEASNSPVVVINYTHQPQDQPVKAAVKIKAACAYITYHASALESVLAFFKPVEQADFSVLEAQAAAGLRKARKAAEEQILGLLKDDREILDLDLEMDAPKLAIPVQASDLVRGEECTLLLDLGYLRLVTDVDEKKKLVQKEVLHYECLKLGINDVGISVVDGEFCWPDHAAGKFGAASIELEQHLCQRALVIPILERCGLKSKIQFTRGKHAGSPPIRLDFEVPLIRFHFSPSRYGRAMKVLTSLMPPSNSTHGVPAGSDDVSFSANAKLLNWEGLGRRIPKWLPHYITVRQDCVYIYKNKRSMEIVKWVRLAEDVQILTPRASQALGKHHVVGLVPSGVDAKSAVEDVSSVMLCMGSRAELQDLLREMDLAKRKIAMLTRGITMESATLEISGKEETADVSDSGAIVEAKGIVNELLIVISGRPPLDAFCPRNTGPSPGLQLDTSLDVGKTVMVSKEVPLVVLREKMGKLDLTFSQSGLEVDLSVNQFAVEDLLIGSSAGERAYLAISRDPDSEAFGQDAGNGGDYGRLIYRKHTEVVEGYTGPDSELILEFSSLWCECHRPTIAALIAMGLDVSDALNNRLEDAEASLDDSRFLNLQGAPSEASMVSSIPQWGDPDRSLFRLSLTMKKLELSANYEDSRKDHMAVAVVENFKYDLDVHPDTIKFTGSLGNAVICDGSIPEGHPNRQLCGLRSGTQESLINLEFQSHTIAESYSNDRVPNGSPFYSLSASLSAVRLVFFYRWLQELLMYIFVMLDMTPQRIGEGSLGMTSEGVAAALQVPGFDQWDGEAVTMVLLDVKLDAPIVHLPRNSDVQECIVVDLGRVQVSNTFHGLGASERGTLVDDILIKCMDMSASVCQGSEPGPNMIEDLGEGTDIRVLRKLRDPSGVLPVYQVFVGIPTIHCRVTDVEYEFIVSTVLENMREATRIPPHAFALTENLYPEVAFMQTTEPLQHLVKRSSQVSRISSSGGREGQKPPPAIIVDPAQIKLKANVAIDSAQLTLMNAHKSGGSPIPLGRLQLAKFQLSYRATAGGDMNVQISIPTIEAIDLRPNEASESTLVLSSSQHQAGTGCAGSQGLTPSLVVLDYDSIGDEQSVVLRIQRPTLMLELGSQLGFCLAITEFAIPSVSLGANMNKEFSTRDILLGKDPYIAETDLWVSPEVRILADRPGVSKFVLDGGGHRLILPSGIAHTEMLPMILVGVGKTLQLKNVTVVNAGSLGSIVQLGPGGRILMADDDDIELIEGGDPRLGGRALRQRSSIQRSVHARDAQTALKFRANISATGVTLNVVDKSSPGVNAAKELPSQQSLVAVLDLESSCQIDGNDYIVQAELKRMMVESTIRFASANHKDSAKGCEISNRILEPCNISAEYIASKTRQSIDLNVDQLVINITPDLLDLMMDIRTLVVDPLTVPSASQPLAKVSTFRMIWSSQDATSDEGLAARFDSSSGEDQDKGYITVWRPQPAAGYGILGDVITGGQKQCRQQVSTVALNSGLVANPISYDKVWVYDGVTIWFPRAPKDYRALGCVASVDGEPPPTTACLCVHFHVLVESSLGECLWLKPPQSLWSVQNAAGTFLIGSEKLQKPKGGCFDLRSPIGIAPNAQSYVSTPSMVSRSSALSTASQKCFNRFVDNRKSLLKDQTARRMTVTTVEFKKVWVDKEASGGNGAGIWRPVVPQGYAMTGDCLEYDGMAPPNGAIVIFDSEQSDFKGTRLLTPPVRFDKIWEDNSGKRDKRLTIYRPVPQHGYVAMGYIAAIGATKPSVDSVRCVNLEAVTQSLDGIGRPHVEMKKNKRHIYGWVCDPKSQNFVISSQATAPPSGDMWKLNLSEDKLSQGCDDTSQFELKVHSGPTSLQIRDLTRIPILEVETHNMAIAASNTGVLMAAYVSFDTSLWSYNSMLKAWEPVLETASFILHVNQNTSGTDLGGVPPGLNLRATSSGDGIRLTLAYSAINSIAKLYRERKAVKDQGGSEMPSSALISADASSIETTVINMLGRPVFLLCDYGMSQKTFELQPINEIQIQLPLAPPPFRHDSSVKRICPKPVLVVGVRHFQLVQSLTRLDRADVRRPSAMRCVVRFTEVDTPHTVRTCASCLSSHGKLTFDEQFIFDLPQDTPTKTLALDIYDITWSAQGGKVATGEIDLSNFAGDSAQVFVVKMMDPANGEAGTMAIELHLEGSKSSVMDNSASNAHRGERGLKLAQQDSWVSVPSTGVQQGKKNGVGSMLGFDQSSLVVAVNVGPGAVLESGYRNGIRQEVIRSLCTFTNSTKTSLMVRVIKAGDQMERIDSMSSLGASGQLPDEIAEEEVYENQRRTPMRAFSHKALLRTDRKRFSLKSTGHQNSDKFPDIVLPPGWEWLGPWEVEVTGNVDSEGWCYATDFKLMKYPPGRGSHKKTAVDFTRRRRWVRRRRKKAVDRPEVAEHKVHSKDVGIVLPGSSFPLPQIPPHGNWQLQVRPVIEGESWHRWSVPVTEDGVTLQNLVKGTRKLGYCPLKSVHGGEGASDLPQELLCSSQFWLTFIVEGNRLPVPVGMDPMTDWTITAQPPLELHNVLPFSGSFMVWERAEGGSPLQIRQQGITCPGEITPIHGADMRKEVALSFYPTDRDFQEDAPITISRGYSEHAAGVSGHQDLPRNFRVSKQGNITRIMLERELDVGLSQREEKLDPGAAVAMGYPLVMRMYVPLWVVNNTEVPINLGIVGIRPGELKLEPDLDGNGGTDVNSIKVVTTFPEQHTRTPPAYTMSTVEPKGTDILSYPLDENPYGVKISVVNSGWTTPIPLGGVKMSKESSKSGKEGTSSDVVRKTLEAGVDVTQRMLVWAQVPDVAKIYPTVAHLNLTASGFIRSKVLILEPHLLVSNRTGIDIQLLQPNTLASSQSRTSPVGSEQLLAAGVSCEPLQWALGCQAHLLCARPAVPGALWSVPFKIAFPEVGDIDVAILNYLEDGPRYLDSPASNHAGANSESSTTLKISVQISSPGCLHVIFQSFGSPPPFAIENRTQFSVQFRQEGNPDPWITVPPLSSQGWALPRLVQAAKRIEIRDVDLAQKPALTRSFSLNPDTPMAIAGGSMAIQSHNLPLAATIEGIRGPQQRQALVEIVDMDDSLSVYSGMGWTFGSAVGCWGQGRVIRIHAEDPPKDQRGSISVPDGDVASKAFGLNLSFGSISVSLVDQHPQELLLLSVEGLEADMMMGVGPRGRFAHARVRVRDVQVDNQLPHAFYPVMVAPWITRARGKLWEEPLTLSLTIVRELGSRQGHMSYPTITSKIGNLQVAIHETVIWRVSEMVEMLGIKPSGEAASADVGLDVGLLHLGGIKLKVSISTDPTSRPRSQPLSLGLEFANVEDVEVEIKGYEAEELSMLQSVLMEQILAHLKGQISGIALSLLDHVFSVGGMSQALAAMGKVIKSSVDDPASRGSKASRVDSLQDGLLEGTAAFGKGLFQGVAGVIQRPVKGAKKDGVEGFFKGMGKGLLGIAVNPLSGALEAVSKVTEGIDVLTSRAEIAARRKRPPLCIRGDRILRVYDPIDAAGQSLMHDAISSGGKGDTEAYGGHRVLSSDRLLMWTTERIALLKGNGIHHWHSNLEKGHHTLTNPNVKKVWSLKWDNLLSLNLELQNGAEALAVFAKTRCNSFNGSLLQIVPTGSGVAQQLRYDLWAAMGRHSVIGGPRLDQGSLVRWTGVMGPEVAPFRSECGDFAVVWKSHHGLAQRIAIWRLKCPPGYASLGHVVGFPNPPNTVPVFLDDSESQSSNRAPRLAIPLGFTLIFRDTNPQTGKLTVWRPLAPRGYVAVGFLMVPDISMPSLNEVRCLREDLCVKTEFGEHMIWRGGSSDLEDLQCSLWMKEGDPLFTFHAIRGLEKPGGQFAWVAMKDSAAVGTPNFESLI